MTFRVYYIDELSCCRKSIKLSQAGDLFYVVDPPLIDVLLKFNIQAETIITPLTLFTKPNFGETLCCYYSHLEESIGDLPSYINWLLSNQVVLIKVLFAILQSYFAEKDYTIVTFKPSYYLNRRLNSGMPLTIYYYLRDTAFSFLANTHNTISFKATELFSFQHSLHALFRYIIPRALYFLPTYTLCRFKCIINTSLLIGAGIPVNTIKRFKQSHTRTIYLKPASEISINDLSFNTIYFPDGLSYRESISWKKLADQIIDNVLMPINTLPISHNILNIPNELSENHIYPIVEALSKNYLKYLRLSSEVYLSDHVNLFTYCFICAYKSSPIPYYLIAHGRERRNPICQQLIKDNLLLPNYLSPFLIKSQTTKTSAIKLNYKTPIILVSYAAFKRIGFKIKPIYLHLFNTFITQIYQSVSVDSNIWPIYTTKKVNSESLLTNLDLLPTLHNIPIIPTQCITTSFPSAVVVAVGQIGTAHVNLFADGHHIIYFGDSLSQTGISFKQYKYTISDHCELLLESILASDDILQAPNLLFATF